MKQTQPKPISAIDLHQWLLKESDTPLLIDVREDEEVALAPFPMISLHLPLSQSSLWMGKLNKELSMGYKTYSKYTIKII